MKMKIGINGFGRIGRLTLRELLKNTDFEVVAINDLADPKMLAHLFKYDTVQGKYEKPVNFDNGQISVDNKLIKVFSEKNPTNLPWGELNVDVVIECTGFFSTKEKAMSHINAGAKKVIISAPAGNDLPTIVYGVNETILKSTDQVISAASCTTNCLAPVVYNLNNLSTIKKGYMTTIHAYTNDQSTLDAPHSKGDLRRARAAALNITPTSTGAAKAIGLVVPELEGKLKGISQRVPVGSGSLIEIIALVCDNITETQINEYMKQCSNESFGYTSDEIVSSDVIGLSCGSLFDATQTSVLNVEESGETLVKLVSWYDNELSYVNQMVRTLNYFVTLV